MIERQAKQVTPVSLQSFDHDVFVVESLKYIKHKVNMNHFTASIVCSLDMPSSESVKIIPSDL